MINAAAHSLCEHSQVPNLWAVTMRTTRKKWAALAKYLPLFCFVPQTHSLTHGSQASASTNTNQKSAADRTNADRKAPRSSVNYSQQLQHTHTLCVRPRLLEGSLGVRYIVRIGYIGAATHKQLAEQFCWSKNCC